MSICGGFATIQASPFREYPVFFIGRPQKWQPLRGLGGAWVLAAALVATGTVQAKEPAPSGTVALQQLPKQAQATHGLILSGGPFPYRKDGTVFGNRERALPMQPRGFYHEYTVPSPGATDRGARRIVCGGAQMAQPQTCFYTADHYASFRRILP